MSTQEDKFFKAAGTPATAAVETNKPRREWKQLGKRVMIEIVLGYLLLCLALFIFQNRIVYMPQKEERLKPDDFGFAKQQARQISTQSPEKSVLNGWQISSDRDVQSDETLKKAPAVVLFFCGNAGNRGDRVQKFRQIANLGVDVVCFDYRGYGDSPGSPNEEGLAADARAAWQYLVSSGISPRKIVLHGESLGGGVAARLASELCSENTPPGGLILEATFTRMADVGAKHYWFLPVSLILTQKFPSIERIQKVTCPLLVMHGGRDELIPIQQGRDIFSAARGASPSGIEKQFVELPACGHNDLGIMNAIEYRDAVLEFLLKVAPELKQAKAANPKKAPAERRPRERRKKTDSSEPKPEPAKP